MVGKYLGPEIDVDPAITANIMNENGEVVHRSTYHGLKEDEWTNKDHILLRKEFDKKIKHRFGRDIYPDNFPEVNLEDTPLYDMYEYDPQMWRVVWQATLKMMRTLIWILYCTVRSKCLR